MVKKAVLPQTGDGESTSVLLCDFAQAIPVVPASFTEMQKKEQGEPVCNESQGSVPLVSQQTSITWKVVTNHLETHE